MSLEKLPPISKVYEAISAVADHRVNLYTKEAHITSSDYSKIYTVRFNQSEYSSNDNATLWQHYPGYPIIAVLIEQKILPVNQTLLPFFEHVPWKQLNTKYKNDYDKAIDEYLQTIPQKGGNISDIEKYTQDTFAALTKLNLIIKGNREKLIKLEKQ